MIKYTSAIYFERFGYMQIKIEIIFFKERLFVVVIFVGGNQFI